MQFLQTLLLLSITLSEAFPQKMQQGSYFLSMILSSSTKISSGSLALMSKVLRISIGRTILPSSSILLTIPVDFISYTPLYKFGAFLKHLIYSTIILQGRQAFFTFFSVFLLFFCFFCRGAMYDRKMFWNIGNFVVFIRNYL